MRTHVKPTTLVQGKARSSRKRDLHSEKRSGGIPEDVQSGKEKERDEDEDDSYLFMGATAVRDSDRTLDNIYFMLQRLNIGSSVLHMITPSA